MEPTLRDGDWLLVDPLAYADETPRAGDLLVVPDPNAAHRWLVKRVASTDPAARTLTLAGDHAAHRADSGAATTVAFAAVLGRPWFRYWPPARLGRPRAKKGRCP